MQCKGLYQDNEHENLWAGITKIRDHQFLVWLALRIERLVTALHPRHALHDWIGMPF